MKKQLLFLLSLTSIFAGCEKDLILGSDPKGNITKHVFTNSSDNNANEFLICYSRGRAESFNLTDRDIIGELYFSSIDGDTSKNKSKATRK